MTTLALRPGWHTSSAEPSAATSPVAALATALFGKARSVVTPSALTQKLCDETISTLLSGYRESVELAAAWDFVRPNEAALAQTQEVIQSLPTWTGAPRPLFEQDGAIALEWEVGEGRFFVAALDGTGYIDYSAIVGHGEEHFGRVPFRGRLPDQAMNLLALLKQR